MERHSKLAQIRRDKHELINLKKMMVKSCDSIISVPVVTGIDVVKDINKAMPKDTNEKLYRTLIANTYNYMDSHDDVHRKGIFSKSISETKKIFLLHDHEFKVTSQIGNILKAYEQDLKWSDVGLGISGDTTALLLDVEIEKEKNAAIFKGYLDKEIDQHSVGMQYINIALAIDDHNDKEAYSLYSQILPTLGNSEKAASQGYFFVVTEAKLRETSAVLMGSNDLTSVLNHNEKNEDLEQTFKVLVNKFENKEIVFNLCEQVMDTFKKAEPPTSTQKDKKPSFYNLVK